MVYYKLCRKESACEDGLPPNPKRGGDVYGTYIRNSYFNHSYPNHIFYKRKVAALLQR